MPISCAPWPANNSAVLLMRARRCHEFSDTSTPLIVGRAGILVRGQGVDAVVEITIKGEVFPFHSCAVEEGVFPIGSRNAGRRLDRPLDEQTLFGAALCGTGDLLVLPQHIELFGANETLPAAGSHRLSSELRRNSGAPECLLNPRVHASVALDGFERVPGIIGRKDETVGPIAVVRHQAAAGWPAHEWTKRGQALN